jgi:TatD DNase family protein
MVDSHCHLDDERFVDDLEAVLDRAVSAGVTNMLTIGTGDGPPEIDRAVKIAERFRPVLASIGVHPHDAAKVTPQTYSDLKALASHPKVVAFGEIGLDYHYDFSPREVQREVFIEQLKLARDVDLPITIHTREAWEDTITILREHWRIEGDANGIMHCFTGTPEQAREALELGFHLAYGGVLTFKTAEHVRESARITPDDRILIETDAPYLAPIPFRGKRNEPSMMVETLRKLAEVRNSTPEVIAALTSDNFSRLCLRRPGLRPSNTTRYTEVSDGN